MKNIIYIFNTLLTITLILTSLQLNAENRFLSKKMSSAATSGCSNYDPDSARLPKGNCKEPKKTIKYDENCAKLYGCDDATKPKKANQKSFSSKK